MNESNELLVSPEEAFRRIGVGRTTGFALLRSGEIPSIKIGRLRRVPVFALEQWVRTQVGLSGPDRAA